MEKHHKVRISDEAVVAAVELSHRYIPARQLPDKAVSLLDTACARVAISQSATPAAIEDAAGRDRGPREREARRSISDSDLGARRRRAHRRDRRPRSPTLKEKLAELEDRMGDRAGASSTRSAACARSSTRRSEPNGEAAPPADAAGRRRRAAAAEPQRRPAADPRGRRASSLREKFDALEARSIPEQRMIYAHVDEQAVASVVSDWTGIPVGRMVKRRGRRPSSSSPTSSTSASSARTTASR